MSDYRIRDVARLSTCEKHTVTPRPGGGRRGGSRPPASRWVHKEAVRLLAESFGANYHGDEDERHRSWQGAWRWDRLTHSLQEANIQARMIADTARDALEIGVANTFTGRKMTPWTVAEAALQVESRDEAVHGGFDFLLDGPYGKDRPWAAATLDIRPGGQPSAWLELAGVLWALRGQMDNPAQGRGVLILAPRTPASRSQVVTVLERPADGLIAVFDAQLKRFHSLAHELSTPTTTPGPHCGTCHIEDCAVRYSGKVRP